jgi:PIN domain nuclease of toxin-antitoxin system
MLLDTHTLLWAVDNVGKLSPVATRELCDPNNQHFVSAATIWEIAIKLSVRKLTISLPFLDWVSKAFADLSVTPEHVERIIGLQFHPRDPFDRLIIA